MNSSNQWNKLSEFFDIRMDGDSIQGGAMDNILIAWPPITRLINKHFKLIKGKKALDYGCGVGEFCYKLSKLGFEVTGIDSSKSMISKARKFLPESIRFIGSANLNIEASERFHLITSIQVFQFINNIENLIISLDSHINKNGLIIFAVFNIEFVKNCIEENILLVNFDSTQNPTKGTFTLGDTIKIPVYIRTAEYYKELFKKYGYELLIEKYPKFTKSFLEKYPLYVSKDRIAPSKDPEFMILGFKKQIIK